MSWEEMQKTREETGSKFIKLKDGGVVEGVFRGDPHFFFKKYQDSNEYDKWADGRSFRFRINFVTKNENNEIVSKIFEQGATVRDLLLDVKEEYGLDCAFKIKRVGSGKDDTRYSILFKEKLNPQLLAVVNAVPLNPLKAKLLNGESAPTHGDDDIPF